MRRFALMIRPNSYHNIVRTLKLWSSLNFRSKLTSFDVMADDLDTIPEILRYRSQYQPDQEVFSFYNADGLVACLNPTDIYTLAGRFATCLREWGFQPGEVIGNGLPNSPERVISDFGILMAGCVMANFQVVEKDGSAFWNTARMSQCKGLVIPNRYNHPAYRLVSTSLPDNASRISGSYDVSLTQAPSIRKVIVCDRRPEDKANSLLEFLRNSDMNILETACAPSDLAVLFGTSGSTGFSKLVPQSHESVLKGGRRFRPAESAVLYSDRPMGWMGGFPFDYLAFGRGRVLQDGFDNQPTQCPAELWSIMTAAKCTGAALLPPTVYRLVDHFRTRPPDHRLQFITSSGQPMKKEMMSAIGLLCDSLVVSYGATEGGMFAFDVITDPAQFKDFYCGKVMDDVKVKVVNEEGNDVQPGTEGKIYLKSDKLVKSYYNQSDDCGSSPNSIYTHDGWFKSGDRGILQPDRSLFCFGREGDVISIGATLVYLSWPESILNKCPDVQNSTVLSIEDQLNGNTKLCACVVPRTGRERPNANSVMEFFNDSLNSSELKLELSHVFVMDNFPLLPSGKIHKRKLKVVVGDLLKTSGNNV